MGANALTGDIKFDIIYGMRYLIDTCVLVSALRSKNGASHLVLQRVLDGQLPIVMHYKLLMEYWDVLTRPTMRPGLVHTDLELERILAALVAIAEDVTVRYLWRPNLRDEKDNFLLEIAIAAQPSTIITHNVRDFITGDLRFPGVLIKRPQDVLTEGFQS